MQRASQNFTSVCRGPSSSPCRWSTRQLEYGTMPQTLASLPRTSSRKRRLYRVHSIRAAITSWLDWMTASSFTTYCMESWESSSASTTLRISNVLTSQPGVNSCVWQIGSKSQSLTHSLCRGLDSSRSRRPKHLSCVSVRTIQGWCSLQRRELCRTTIFAPSKKSMKASMTRNCNSSRLSFFPIVKMIRES